MAHNINRMAYAGSTPWHGLGTALPANADWETIRPLAGFYVAEERPLFYPGATSAVPDRKALVRGDSGAYLSTVGNDYQVLQFDELAEAGVRASGDFQAIWHTAGTLGDNGSRGWMLGELPEPIRVRGDESEIRKYVLLTTAHDGRTAAKLKNVATRVVCQNTLGSALREAGSEWSIRHTRSAQTRLAEAATAFKKVVAGYERFGALANALAVARFTAPMVEEFHAAVLPVDEEAVRTSPNVEARRRVAELAEYGAGIGGELRGTAWGWFQGFTEWADHERTVRLAASNPAARLGSNWLGGGADLKAKALEKIRELVAV